MGEEGSVTPTAGKHLSRTPMASRLLQSPTFHLGANDDQLERAQARAAASIRRRSTAPSPSPAPAHLDLLRRDQIMDLFHNCIKLASENKINQKNTWELSLIDHLSDIIRDKSEEDAETNFQKASCTLEAGVKIYSLRVDSVHSEAYKVLGGINRAGQEEDRENVFESEHTEQADNFSKKELERKMSPLSTLESSFEALNVKKFDVAFTVDPLYHQTSAQFDEGGAKGLLLNNLGVYGGCRVLFDSLEIPEQSISCENHHDNPEVIDLSFVNEYIGQMMSHTSTINEISPTLRDIINQFDEDNSRPSSFISALEKPMVKEAIDEHNDANMEGNTFDDCEPCTFDQDDSFSVVDDYIPETYQTFGSYTEENSEYTFQNPDVDEKLEKIAGSLSLGLGLTSQSNAWAGPDHWKYRKTKGLEQVSVTSSISEQETKKPKNRKVASDIDFTKSLDKDMACIFAPPKNPKSLLLPKNKLPSNITLPEDCHYKPESLVKLFLIPDVMCLGKKGRIISDELRQQNDACVPLDAWGNFSMTDDYVDDENINSDIEDQGGLVCQPRQVNKVDIQYDKVSKQVDVHALKDMLWNHMKDTIKKPCMGCEATVSFRQVLGHFPAQHSVGSIKDVSPHLFFICLLHLANEHCLSIHGHPSLDELDVNIPTSALCSDNVSSYATAQMTLCLAASEP